MRPGDVAYIHRYFPPPEGELMMQRFHDDQQQAMDELRAERDKALEQRDAADAEATELRMALEKVTRWLETVLTQQEVHGIPISAHTRDAVAEARALLATDGEEDGDA